MWKCWRGFGCDVAVKEMELRGRIGCCRRDWCVWVQRWRLGRGRRIAVLCWSWGYKASVNGGRGAVIEREVAMVYAGFSVMVERQCCAGDGRDDRRYKVEMRSKEIGEIENKLGITEG